MLTAHRIALDPNNKQATHFAKAAGTARFAYNWALAEWGRQYEAWKQDNTRPRPSRFALEKQLCAIKREQFPWMGEVTKCAPQEAIKQLDKAFRNFFAGRARYPKPRKKGRHDRFTIQSDKFTIKDKRIRIPRLGWVRMRQALRFQGKIVQATVSRTAARWYVAIIVDVPDLHRPQAENQGAVGVDLGITDLATLSTGEKIPGPKPYKALLGRLKRLSRSLSRKQKGSANRRKAAAKVAKLHARFADIRRDALHKATTDLVRRFKTICLEDLNVRGMERNRHLARAIVDQGFCEFRRQVEYKAAQAGGRVIVADRFFASSKTCSACGHKLAALPLKVREWACPACGAIHDRDINAATNLKNLAGSSPATACGGEGAGLGRKPKVKPAPMKQEANGKATRFA